MHFLVFIPGVQGANPEHLVNVGLADLAAGANYLHVAAGPNGQSGVIAGWIRPGAMRQEYAPTEQTWIPAARTPELDLGRYQVGVWNESPPTPGDLSRPYMEQGTTVTLGDGQGWLLPRFRELPRDIRLADDGSLRFEPQRQYHALWLESCRWFERIAEATPQTGFPYAEMFTFVLRALAINYRLTPELASHLRLFSTDNLRLALLAILENPDAEAAHG